MSVVTDIEKFYSSYEGEKGIIGYSVKNYPLYYFAKINTSYPVLIATFAIHAREYITSYLAQKLIKDYVKFSKFGSAYFIPLLNPDGALIAQTKNKLYKANYNKVDLNVNFDACWGKGKNNLTSKNYENYIGKYPFSEPETFALKNFTLLIQPDITMSFHSKGEEIYWEFNQSDLNRKRDYKIAQAASRSTGYKLVSLKNSCGGYKDWCIEKLKIPSLTIEVGEDKLKHPIRLNKLPQIYKKNSKIINDVMLSVFKS